MASYADDVEQCSILLIYRGQVDVKERQQQEREAISRAILDAARTLFVAEGYQNVSIRKIAERIGYSPAAIYSYFDSKDDIFLALAEEGFHMLFESGVCAREAHGCRARRLHPRRVPRSLRVQQGAPGIPRIDVPRSFGAEDQPGLAALRIRPRNARATERADPARDRAGRLSRRQQSGNDLSAC